MISTRIFRRLCSAVAEDSKKPKEKLIKRLGAYLKMVVIDYKMVAVETGQDITAHPVKASIYFSLLGTVIYLAKTNPSEESFKIQLLENGNELLQVGEPIRNPHSDSHIQNLQWSYNRGEMRRFNLGLCSLMWNDNFAKEVDLYEAQCKPLKVGWLEFKERIVDIGVIGRWLWMEKAMIDYDINPQEWPDVQKHA